MEGPGNSVPWQGVQGGGAHPALGVPQAHEETRKVRAKRGRAGGAAWSSKWEVQEPQVPGRGCRGTESTLPSVRRRRMEKRAKFARSADELTGLRGEASGRSRNLRFLAGGAGGRSPSCLRRAVGAESNAQSSRGVWTSWRGGMERPTSWRYAKRCATLVRLHEAIDIKLELSSLSAYSNTKKAQRSM